MIPFDTSDGNYDIDAEKAILGSILYDNSIIDEVIYSVSPDHFYNEKNKWIYLAMYDLHSENKAIDEILISGALKDRGHHNLSNELTYISSLVDCSPQIENVDEYIKIVRDKFELRELERLKSIKYGQQTSKEAIGNHLKEVNKLNDTLSTESNLDDIKTIMKGVIVDCEKIIEGDGDVVGLKTGFTDFDKKTLGLQREELTVLGARPSMGKSSMFLNIAYNIARRYRDETVLVFSLEMSKKQLVQRLQASIAKVNLTKIREVKDLTQDEWDKIMMATNEISDLPILINDDSLISIEKICSIAKQYAKKNKISTIIIDYLGKLKYDGKYQNEEIKISNITSMSKDLAKKLDCNVLLLSQLNRSLESRTNKRPVMSDLKGSGAIEADADLVMFIYRDSVYNENSKEKGIAEILIRKNRSGETGTVKLAWQGKYTKFSNFTDSYDYN